MILKKLNLLNFMPYYGEHEIVFPTPGDRNVLLIYGDNQRGKTSILNALRWCLYGKALGRHLRVIPRENLLNQKARRLGEKRAEVRLEFTSEGRHYRLMRKLEGHGPASQSRDFVEKLGLIIDGAAVSASDVPHEINQVIPAEVSRFFLFDGELLEHYERLLLQEGGDPEEIKEAVESVLGVPALRRARDHFEALRREAQKQQAAEARRLESTKAYGEQQKRSQDHLDAIEADILRLSAHLEELTETLSEIEARLAETATWREKKKELDLTEDDVSRVEADLAEDELRRRELLRDGWREVLRPRLELKAERASAEVEEYQEAVWDKASTEARMRFLREILVSSDCPVCTQPVSESARRRVGAILGSMEGGFIETEVIAAKWEEAAAKKKALEKLLRQEPIGLRLEDLERDIAQNRVKLVRAESRVEKLRAELEGIDVAEMERNKAKRKHTNEIIGQIKASLENRKGEQAQTVRKLDELSRLISAVPEQRLHKANFKAAFAEELKELFGKAVERLRDNVKIRIEEYATETFLRLTTEQAYSRLEITDSYGLAILDSAGQKVVERSAGAEQIVALSLLDGLKRCGIKEGPIVMDTALARLDPAHRRNVLTALPHMAKQVVLLIHEGELRRDAELEPLGETITGIYEIGRISEIESQLTKVNGLR